MLQINQTQTDKFVDAATRHPLIKRMPHILGLVKLFNRSKYSQLPNGHTLNWIITTRPL